VILVLKEYKVLLVLKEVKVQLVAKAQQVLKAIPVLKEQQV
jgi:hypothetical protein